MKFGSDLLLHLHAIFIFFFGETCSSAKDTNKVEGLWVIGSSNPRDATATHDRELKRAKLAWALRVGGGAYSFFPLPSSGANQTRGVCELTHVEWGG